MVLGLENILSQKEQIHAAVAELPYLDLRLVTLYLQCNKFYFMYVIKQKYISHRLDEGFLCIIQFPSTDVS